jgi:SAM-dependent methyltransferase
VAVVPSLSPRLGEIVDALPLRPGLRVIEIGCGPGAAAREVAERVGPDGHVLAIDRSSKAIRQLASSASDLIASGRLSVRDVACEDLELEPGEARYDLVFAVRVGALDGRHPDAGARALARLAHAVVPGGRLFVDGGDPLREIALPPPR